jgi:large subunit ribosomal protein L21
MPTPKTHAQDFAVIMTGGKQYRVSPGEKLTIEKLDPQEGDQVVFDQVLLRSIDGTVQVGTPTVAKATVEAKLLGDFKDKTKIVFKYHSKTRFKKKKGHRQPHTEVQITKI